MAGKEPEQPGLLERGTLGAGEPRSVPQAEPGGRGFTRVVNVVLDESKSIATRTVRFYRHNPAGDATAEVFFTVEVPLDLDGDDMFRYLGESELTTIVPPATLAREATATIADVERQVYDAELATRMKAAREARAQGAPSWPGLRRALRPSLEAARAKAQQMLGEVVTKVDLHDGHVAEVQITAMNLLARGARLLERAPWIHHLHVIDYAVVGPMLFDSPLLGRIQSMGLVEQGLQDDDVLAMAASPHLANLRWLDLSGNQLTTRAHEAIAMSKSLSQLVYVGLDRNPVASPADQIGDDVIDGSVVSSWTTEAGRMLERKARRSLAWLHAAERFPRFYPPTPEDVATAS